MFALIVTISIITLSSQLIHGQQQSTNCPKQCFTNAPVCASNGKMYRSKCEMEMKNCGKNVTVIDMKQCTKDHGPCPKLCLEIYDPVCGDDGKMYSNKCLMQKLNCHKKLVKIVDKSFCINQTRQSRNFDDCPKSCLLIDKPVCGSDKTLYRNECVMRQKNCGKRVTSIDIKDCVQETRLCPNRCLTIPDPVCGSDGKWYLNQCWLNYTNCGKSPAVIKVGKDQCKGRLTRSVVN